ncbi:membrane-associated protein [Nakamurella panacisegetis]|uniref:Membrane-associated protein n=1 Tax=Nakamurella panacisegetis TaxID=1090615 RepID=A0A1H0QSW1_9ACTN|nr:DedA family protein [Nakamurella panacisegetis]SDP19768.1 membrane-associated protein [Nakamurella panacisegetis]
MSSLAAGFNPLDATSVIAATGLVGIFCVLVAETGLLVGFFLPGDSLLFSAGLLAASHGALHLPLAGVLVVAAAGALIGAQIGYWIGRTLGTSLLARASRPALLRATERVTEVVGRYGPAKAIVLARFIPVVRTVMNPMAGMIGISQRLFTTWQILGGLVWSLGVTMLGFWLGSQITGIDKYLLPIIAVVVIVSLIPVALELRRMRRERASAVDPGTPVIHRAGDAA